MDALRRSFPYRCQCHNAAAAAADRQHRYRAPRCSRFRWLCRRLPPSSHDDDDDDEKERDDGDGSRAVGFVLNRFHHLLRLPHYHQKIRRGSSQRTMMEANRAHNAGLV